jgi:hypothetical protein
MNYAYQNAHIPDKDLKAGDIILLAHTDPWSLAQNPRLDGSCFAVHIDKIVHDQLHAIKRDGRRSTGRKPYVTFRPVLALSPEPILGEADRFSIEVPGSYAWLATELPEWQAYFGLAKSAGSRELAAAV